MIGLHYIVAKNDRNDHLHPQESRDTLERFSHMQRNETKQKQKQHQQ